MAYAPNCTKFSDYHVSRLIPWAINRSVTTETEPPFPDVDLPLRPGIKFHPQTRILIYDAEAARYADMAWEQASIDILPPGNMDYIEDIEEDAIDIERIVQESISDSGRPPSIIFTSLPKLRGLVAQ